ncbi:MAG: tetratricopeptide repeat protein [Bacteroidetes bacterium]|nr:tetratricopeptide repeat protein [Bacteroidota bacterium]MBS1931304.1 tetratricopeptide repeat protein [Bacteroidota bacterium]
MRHLSKILVTILTLNIFFLSSCKNGDDPSPYYEILSQPPFASLTDSIKKEPGRDELYFHRAVLLNKNNFPEPALADFKKAWSLKKNEQYALGIGTILLNKRPDSAISFLNEALQKIPQSLFLRLSLAKAYESQNKISDALTVCDKILQIDPHQLDALLLKADLLDQQNNASGAITVLEKAYSINPDILELDYKLAYKYATAKNPKTIAFCDTLLFKDSLNEHAEPLYFKGVYYENTGNKKKALDFFSQAIVRDYTFLDAYMNKGEILFDQKKYPDAIKVYRLALNVQSTYADAYFWMGKCEEALGQKAEAKLNYERAYGLDKTFTEAKDAADRIKN